MNPLALRATRALFLALPLLASPAAAFQGPSPGIDWQVIDSLPFAIEKPGAFYLERDLSTGATFAISVFADDVVIDLNGFTLSGDHVGAVGIGLSSGRRNVSVVNGTIAAFTNTGLSGIDLLGGTLSEVDFVRNGRATRLGRGLLVQDCRFLENQIAGCATVDECIVQRCTAIGNGGAGLEGILGGSFSDCTAIGNVGAGFALGGGRAIVLGCTAIGNGTDGFLIGADSLIEDCEARDNDGRGIITVGGAVLRDNHCADNGAAGIEIFGFGCRVEANHCLRDDLSVVSASNVIVGNSVAGGVYAIGSDNLAGPILGASQLATSSNPHANYVIQIN